MWLAKQKQLHLAGHLLLSSSSRRLPLGSLRFFSGSVACGDPARPPGAPHLMVDYVVRWCGLSRSEAIKASRSLVHLKSSEKSDAVLCLLRQEGLGDAHIRLAITRHPHVLVANPKKTLQPKFAALRGAGFSGSELAQLISTCPAVLKLRIVQVLPRVEFWRNLLGTNQNFLKVIHRDPRLLSYRLEERIIPNISFLRSLGLSEERIMAMVVKGAWVIQTNVDKLKAHVQQVQSLGVPPGSGMFGVALCILSCFSRSTLDAKCKLLRSFGWSEADVAAAFSAFPSIFAFSSKKIQVAMDFLLGVAGCMPSYVARRPVLLGYSMEKRLIPRHQVLHFLRMKGLPGGDGDLFSAMTIPQKKFVDKYIIPNNDKHPELLKAYLAATAKTISS